MLNGHPKEVDELDLVRKFRETALSVVPLLLIVIVLQLTIAPIGWDAVGVFAIGSLLIIVGLSLFLLGTEIGIVPVGQNTGSALVKKRNLPLMLTVGFIIGVVITIAEPQVQVLAGQVTLLAPHVNKNTLVIAISLGVGLFVAVSFARIIFSTSYRYLILTFYLMVMVLAILVDSFFLGIAFDAGGATTGPMTVPFILALGVGVAGVRKSKNSEQDSFGLVGIASIGPIAAVLIMGLGGKTESSSVGFSETETAVEIGFSGVLGSSAIEVVQALAPLALLFVIFQITLLHQQRRTVIRMIQGLIYAGVGLVLFLVGVNGAFMPVGRLLGASIGASSHLWVLIPIGLFLGAVVVLAEPAVWVLTDQVRDVSGGSINRSMVLVFFSIGVSIAVGLAMLRVVSGLPLALFLIPGYAIAMLLMFLSPPFFTAIAFDSGGVASGPMSSSFLLAFTLGASAAAGGDPFSDAFGIVALIAMTPLITIQLLGIIYKRRSTNE
ncbi:DUF1538 domain-containing protein [Pleomorphochaeta sp. DL1XJH-081]|uniref:DUF1538 domain-containing protein n=1 Tax=Pleomorphochaeta sp. DL1XJH-081 TaxID=3409690 RepID=UPI003BB76810